MKTGAKRRRSVGRGRGKMPGMGRVLALAAPLALCAGGASLGWAAEQGGAPFELGTVRVTASRPQVGEIAAEQVGTVVRRQEMLRFGRETVGEALNLLPGVTVSNNVRNEGLVFVRGFDARQVPLLIDGVPVYVPYDGYVDFNRFITGDLAAIQVAKGFGSVAYGPNALGGAINLVSRKPTQPLQGDASVGAGAGADRVASVNLGTRQSGWYAQLGLAYREADGFRLPSSFSPTPTEDGGLRNNSDRRDTKISLKLGVTPHGSDEYALTLLRQDGQKGQPPSTGSSGVRYWRWPYWDKESVYLVSQTALGGHEQLKLRLYHDAFDNEVNSYTDATFTRLRTSGAGSVSTGRSIYADRASGASAELVSRRWAGHTWRLVWQQRRDRHEEFDATGARQAAMSDRIRSLGLEDAVELAPRWQLSLAVARHTLAPRSISSVGNAYRLPGSQGATDVQAGVFYELSPQQTAYATLARKTRLPTLKDRYSQRLGNYVENPELGPERALHAELGYQGQPWASLPGVVAEAALFAVHTQDQIQSVFVRGGSSCSPATPCQMQNVGRTRTVGVELGASGPLGGKWDAGGHLTLMDRRNRSNPGLRLTGVPERKLLAHATYKPAAGWALQATWEQVGARWASQTTRLSGYGLLGLTLRWQPSARTTVQAGVDNALDKLYELEAGFPGAGRSWFVRVNHQF